MDKTQSTKLAKSCGLDNSDDDAEGDDQCFLYYYVDFDTHDITRHKLYTYRNISRFCGFSSGLP